MNCVPSLPVSNRFAVLKNEHVNISETNIANEIPVTPKPPEPNKPRSRWIRKWEKCLPKSFVVAAAPGPRSLTVKVALQSTDTGEVFSTLALVDCSATGQFINRGYVEKNRLNTRKLVRVDSTRNEAGSITEVVDTILCFEDHT